jgi:5'-3' exonuclease
MLVVHLLDGTYELFRHFYGARNYNQGKDAPLGGVAGVLRTVLEMLEKDATHIGVATDHVVESFRNQLWPGYKTSEGMDRGLYAQFQPLEEALAAMGVVVWPMAADPRVERVCIWTPDKDLAQCVNDGRVVQVDRRSGAIRDASGVREKFGVDPERIPDYLALVGDSSDGYPGIPGIGPKSAQRLIARHGPIEAFPDDVLGTRREVALLFKRLATLRADAPLFAAVESLRWRGLGPDFDSWAARIGDPRLAHRAHALDDRARGKLQGGQS